MHQFISQQNQSHVKEYSSVHQSQCLLMYTENILLCVLVTYILTESRSFSERVSGRAPLLPPHFSCKLVQGHGF